MAALVTIEQVDLALKLDLAKTATGEPPVTSYTDERLPDIEWKMQQATDIVIDYIKQPEHKWTTADVPGEVSASIIIVIRNLLDDADTPINNAVRNLLHRRRDPAMA